MKLTIKQTNAPPKMHWYEEDEKATPLQAVSNAGDHYHQKYGHVPVSADIPQEWQEAASEIAAALHGLKVTVDQGLQPRTVAVTHIIDRESE